MTKIDLSKLREPFAPNEIEWRVGATSSDKTKGIALPYITNRAVQNRLDAVCGAENWRSEFREWRDNGQICRITINIDGHEIGKEDGAENTAHEPVKGGLSAAMKRAAAQWGIGRYLYDLPTYWVPIKKSGNTYKLCSLPQLPDWALPNENKGKKNNYSDTSDLYNENEETLQDAIENDRTRADMQLSEKDAKKLIDTLKIYEEQGLINIQTIYNYYKVRDAHTMTYGQYANCLNVIAEKQERREKKKADTKK